MPSVRINFDEDSLFRGVSNAVKRLRRKMTAPEVKKEVTGEYAKVVAKYVPYKTGALLESASVVRDGDNFAVRYSAKSKKGYDYADVQYKPEAYGRDESLWNRTTAGTYSHWNRHLTSADREQFRDEVARILKESTKRGG